MGVICFSRNGTTCPFGKLTVPVGPYKLPADTVAILVQEAAKLNMTLHEFLRELAIVRAHGKHEVERVYARRLTVVVGKVDESL